MCSGVCVSQSSIKLFALFSFLVALFICLKRKLLCRVGERAFGRLGNWAVGSVVRKAHAFPFGASPQFRTTLLLFLTLLTVRIVFVGIFYALTECGRWIGADTMAAFGRGGEAQSTSTAKCAALLRVFMAATLFS